MSESKLIHSKIDGDYERNYLNENFETLLSQALEVFKIKSNKHLRLRARFAKELNQFAKYTYKIELQFSEKDMQRLRFPKRQVHTKHSLEIIRCMREYIAKCIEEEINRSIYNNTFIIDTFNNISELHSLWLNIDSQIIVLTQSDCKTLERENDRVEYFIQSIGNYNQC